MAAHPVLSDPRVSVVGSKDAATMPSAELEYLKGIAHSLLSSLGSVPLNFNGNIGGDPSVHRERFRQHFRDEYEQIERLESLPDEIAEAQGDCERAVWGDAEVRWAHLNPSLVQFIASCIRSFVEQFHWYPKTRGHFLVGTPSVVGQFDPSRS